MVNLRRILKKILGKGGEEEGRPFSYLFYVFQHILTLNNKILDQMAEANEKLGGEYVFDKSFIEQFIATISKDVQQLIFLMNEIAPGRYEGLFDAYKAIELDIQAIMAGQFMGAKTHVLHFDDVEKGDEDSIGPKNASLCLLKKELSLQIPAGFAITFYAYKEFLSSAGLEGKIHEVMNEWEKGDCSTEEASQLIQSEILSSPIPSDLKHSITHALSILRKKIGRKSLLAIRSSAWGEDSEHSFAGLYESVIGVNDDGIFDAYKKVIASTFNAKVMEYRRQIGYKEDEILMAVGCEQLIDPEVSGIIYTLNPNDPGCDNMIINSTWGLGGILVSGKTAGDVFIIDRETMNIVGLEIGWKEQKRVVDRDGSLKYVAVEENCQEIPSLSKEQIKMLAKTAATIERFFKMPQDIEFAIDGAGKVVILQSRPLKIREKIKTSQFDLSGLDERYQILIKDSGHTVQEGVGIGPVYTCGADHILDDFPTGAIALAKYASPRLARIVPRASGIITEIGSVAGHLATICREYGLPAIFNVKNAIEILKDQGEITLDATEKTVYKGKVKELFYYTLSQEPIGESYEFRLLRRILRKIEPLNLVDPNSPKFRPESCKTFHDITRFVHEKAVEAIIDLHYEGIDHSQSISARMKWDIPLDLVVIDIGGGLDKESLRRGAVRPENILSIPMQKLMQGLRCPGAWDNDPMSVDVSSFMSSLTRTFSAEYTDPKKVGQNLAVLSKHYVNLSLRLGYHFTMVDSYVSRNIIENYIYFRFFGGVTDLKRRSRRAKLISDILSFYDFRVENHGDLVVARLKRFGQEDILRRLYLVGILIGFTRQLDVLMVSDEHVSQYEKKIIELMEEKNGQGED